MQTVDDRLGGYRPTPVLRLGKPAARPVASRPRRAGMPASPWSVVRRLVLGDRFRLPSLLLSLLLALAFLVLTEGGRRARPVDSLAGQLDRLLVRSGLGINQVTLSGHRYTSDDAIYEALALDRDRSIFAFDALEAKQRLESLPWIASAVIVRRLPDNIAVIVTERTPFAIWRRSGAGADPSAAGRAAAIVGLATAHLIDESGRVLAPIGTIGTALGLPVVAGDGAPAETAALLRALSAHPPLRDGLELATRVGERRWTLHMKSGLTIHLPAEGAVDALDRLRRLDASHALLERDVVSIDLRLPDRLALRLTSRSAAAAAPSAAVGQ